MKRRNISNSHPNNIVDFSTFNKRAINPALRFSVSSRAIRPDLDLPVYLKVFFKYLHLGQIKSVFGSTVFGSLLYGGRPYEASESLTDAHLQTMQMLGLNLTLTLTNHFFDETVYQHSFGFLEKLHRPGTTINVVADSLARRLRKDFPDFTLNASIIKNLNTHNKISQALSLYDSVVVPMDKNNDDDFLEGLPQKNRLILFGNAACAYNCPARTCYLGFSQEIQSKPITSCCSGRKILRPYLGVVYFDLEEFFLLGFTHFKLIPDKSQQFTKEFASPAQSEIS